MKKSKRNKAQKRQQALQQRRQQHFSTRRPLSHKWLQVLGGAEAPQID